jgi:hypothetical protein
MGIEITATWIHTIVLVYDLPLPRKTFHNDNICNMTQEEGAISWEATGSIFLSKKCICICIYVLFRTVSVLELFHCTVAKLLIRKRYYILFLIPLFIVSRDKIGTVYPV